MITPMVGSELLRDNLHIPKSPSTFSPNKPRHAVFEIVVRAGTETTGGNTDIEGGAGLHLFLFLFIVCRGHCRRNRHKPLWVISEGQAIPFIRFKWPRASPVSIFLGLVPSCLIVILPAEVPWVMRVNVNPCNKLT